MPPASAFSPLLGASTWPSPSRTDQRFDALAISGTSNQHCQPLESGFFFLCVHHPEDRCSLVPGGLCAEKIVSFLTCPQFLFVRGIKLDIVSLFVRIDSGSFLGARLKCCQAWRVHQPQFCQLLCLLNIDSAPCASRLARRQSDGIADLVDAFSDTIDPAKAERGVHHLRPGNTRFP